MMLRQGSPRYAIVIGLFYGWHSLIRWRSASMTSGEFPQAPMFTTWILSGRCAASTASGTWISLWIEFSADGC